MEKQREFDGSESDRERELNEYNETKAGVRGLTEAGVTKLPRIFILPSRFQPNRNDASSRFRVPVVDLYQGERRGAIVDEIRKACETWGVFQVINHGVPIEVVSGMLQATLEFHEQPKESKVQYYTCDASKAVAYRSTVHPLLRTALWKDTLACMFDGNGNDQNPQVPLVCREAMYKYVEHMFTLKSTLSGLLSESLGLASDHLERTECIEAQKLAAHYYPPCPEPHLTLGSPKHADPYFLTIISQNLDGLQVLHQDHWIEVPPLQGALVIIIGDMLQIMSNDLYKSVEHRALARGVETRVSVACFFYPSKRNATTKYGVIDELVTKKSPALYRETSLVEYLKYFGANGIVGSKALPHFKCMEIP
ncbi:hypothetical protein V2J09_015639 [Rumex salicifolius]